MKFALPAFLTTLIAGGAEAQPAQAQPRSVAPPAMQRNAPDLAGYTDRVLFGDVWRRPELAPRDRSLVTVAVLIATGRTGQLEGHLGRALDNRVTPAEISGLVTHLAFYAGWPSAVSALDVIDRVFRARGIEPVAASAAPLLPVPASDAARAATVARTVGATAPKLAELTNDVLFADLWRRPDLAPRDRSLATIAALAAGGDADQLAFHLQRGIENGLTRAQIFEALTHLAFYAGWPKAMAAVTVATKTFAPAEAAVPPLTIVKPGTDPAAGPADRFTAAVEVTAPFKASGDARLSGATVTFQPGARSNWHSHPLGQLLIVTEGEGFVQVEGEAARRIGAGDTVWTAPGVKHWHGATPTSAMRHVAVAEAKDGTSVAWAEPVTDAQYRAAK